MDRKRRIYNLNSKLPRKSTIIKLFKYVLLLIYLVAHVIIIKKVANDAECTCEVQSVIALFGIIDFIILIIYWGSIWRFLKKCWNVFPD